MEFKKNFSKTIAAAKVAQGSYLRADFFYQSSVPKVRSSSPDFHSKMASVLEQENEDLKKTSPSLPSLLASVNEDRTTINECHLPSSQCLGKKKKKSKKSDKNWTASDISEPFEFAHISGVQISSQGFKMIDNSRKMKENEINEVEQDENKTEKATKTHDSSSEDPLVNHKSVGRAAKKEFKSVKPQCKKKSKNKCKKVKTKTPRISKLDISEPTGFIHVSGKSITNDGFQMVEKLPKKEEKHEQETENMEIFPTVPKATIRPNSIGALGSKEQKCKQTYGNSTKLSKEVISYPTDFVHIFGVKSSKMGLEILDNSSKIGLEAQKWFRSQSLDILEFMGFNSG